MAALKAHSADSDGSAEGSPDSDGTEDGIDNGLIMETTTFDFAFSSFIPSTESKHGRP
jgi:hypothetical protein